MLILILGGAASGKSAYAEAVATRQPGTRVYLATMEPMDAESRARIAKHCKMRADKRFITIERYTDIGKAEVPPGASVLLECMSNLVANERYSPAGAGEHAPQAILRGVETLLQTCACLTIVTGEVFSDGVAYAGDTRAYLQQLALINRALAQRADAVVEVVAGLPNVLKGALACGTAAKCTAKTRKERLK